MKNRSAFIVFLIVTTAAGGCASRRVPAAVDAQPPVELVAAVILPPSTAPASERVGGLSGLARGAAGTSWIAVADDRDVPRWYSIRAALFGRALTVEPGAATRPQPPADGVVGPVLTDFEAVAFTPAGRLLIACEGDFVTGARRAAALLLYEPDGRYVGPVALPEKFLPAPEGAPERGLRDNHGFEGLTLGVDGTRGWAVSEGPLYQDGEPADFARGAVARLVQLLPSGDSYRTARELVYPIDPVGAIPGMPPGAVVVDQTPSELTTLDDGRLLSMERAFVRDEATGWWANVIRIFEVSTEGADDVSGVESLARLPAARPVRKRVLIDLADIAPRLPARLARLENFEAMAPGPRLPDGRPTLLLASDDNFSDGQVTAFVLLALR